MNLLSILTISWCVVIIASLPVHNDKSTDKQDQNMDAEVFQKSNITSKSGQCRGYGMGMGMGMMGMGMMYPMMMGMSMAGAMRQPSVVVVNNGPPSGGGG